MCDWKLRYAGPLRSLWQGRKGEAQGTRVFHYCNCIDLVEKMPKFEKGSIAILGFASDEGVKRNQGREGAIEGPKALKKAFAGMPYHGNSQLKLYDCGEIRCDDGDLEKAQSALGYVVGQLRMNGAFPIVLGGGHEIAWGHYQGLRDAKGLGIINFDAHFDLRPVLDGGLGSSGTPFLQICNDRKAEGKEFDYMCIGVQKLGNTRTLFETADKLGVSYVYADEFFTGDRAAVQENLQKFIDDHESIYLTFCLDVFSESHAPGVSAPQVLGLEPWQVIPLLEVLSKSGKVVSFDIAEMSPRYDRNGITAKLGATLAHLFI